MNTSDHYGWTPLHEASNAGNLDMLQLLLQHPAIKIDTTGTFNVAEQQFTPLHDAAENGHLHACKLLVQAGADSTKTTVHGFRPTDLARANGHILTQQYLAASGSGHGGGGYVMTNMQVSQPQLAQPIDTQVGNCQYTSGAFDHTIVDAYSNNSAASDALSNLTDPIAVAAAVVTTGQRQAIQEALLFLFADTRSESITTGALVAELDARRLAATVTAMHIQTVLQDLSNENSVMVTERAEIIRI